MTRLSLMACLAVALFASAANAEERIEGATVGTPADPPAVATPPSGADKDAPEKVAAPKEPQVHHTPLASHIAGTPLEIGVDIDDRERVKRVLLIHKNRLRDKPRVVALDRTSGGHYVALLAAERLQRPGFLYSIELELDDGERREAFATRAQPQRIQVLEDPDVVIEAQRLERIAGRRSQFEMHGEYVSFGTSHATVLEGTVPRNVEVDDMYWLAEGAYRYRLLGFIAHLGMRAGVLRGRAPVEAESDRPSGDRRFDVGLNYVAPDVRFRLHDAVHADVELLTSLTEQGFAFGGGGALLFGDPLATHVALGFHGIEGIGLSASGRLAMEVTDWLVLGPTIEVTNMPSAERFGVRLLGDVGISFDGFAITARAGYQARETSSGGPTLGGMAAYAF